MSRATPKPRPDKARLDKWLWAARFFKSRSLAKAAIDGGKVRLNGSRARASKEVGVGDGLAITRGQTVQTVIVAAVAERRGNATLAATLYAETPESMARREADRAERRARRAGFEAPRQRPDKRARRRLRGLRETRDREAPSDS